MLTRVVVAGFGHPLRRDDAAGWRVAEALAGRESVTVLTAHQPLPEWSLALAEADVAYFVDASVRPGDMLRLRSLRPSSEQLGMDGHQLGVQHLLNLCQALYGSAPLSYLLELPLHDVDFGESVSTRTQLAVDQAVRLLERRLTRLP